MTKSPFLKERFHFIMTGGFKINTTETLSEEGWEMALPDLPTPEFGHCMVPRDSKSVIVIAASKTYLMESRLSWANGPPLATPKRYANGCGRILQNENSSSFSIIVAGGEWTSSVEILDPGASQWRPGPSLPIEIARASMVEDPLGGVILIGGFDRESKFKTFFSPLPLLQALIGHRLIGPSWSWETSFRQNKYNPQRISWS